MSRSIASLAYTICVLLTNLSVVPIGAHIEISKLSFWWVSSSATSTLFFLRVRAVYAHSKATKILFTFLLLVIAISPASQLYNSRIPCHSATVNYCDTWSPLSLIPNGAIFINDTLVFLFVSRQVYANATFVPRLRGKFLSRVRSRMALLLTGGGLFRISRALLRSGLLYYGCISPPSSIWSYALISPSELALPLDSR